ncbi:MAG: polymer-forming cytoskeletal protein [Opitutales bacterium]|nr:polymer-forming cytoskeletal protein [Opitutales bacterium]
MKDQPEKQMIVGYGISVEGRIENCDRLVLDGNMNCELSDLKTLIISDSGHFKGKGHVDEAEISGRFDGELIVDGHIVIMESGCVDGKITYKSIEIKPGGKFTGQIILQDTIEEDSEPESKKSSGKEEDEDENQGDFIDEALQGRIMSPSADQKKS